MFSAVSLVFWGFGKRFACGLVVWLRFRLLGHVVLLGWGLGFVVKYFLVCRLFGSGYQWGCRYYCVVIISFMVEELCYGCNG